VVKELVRSAGILPLTFVTWVCRPRALEETSPETSEALPQTIEVGGSAGVIVRAGSSS